VSFCVWLLSLMFSRFIPTIEHISTSFLFMDEWHLTLSLLYIHSSTVEYLWIVPVCYLCCKWLCEYKFWILIGVWQRMELLGHIVTLGLTFIGISKQFSVMAVQFYIPTWSVLVFQCNHILSSTWYFLLKNYYNHPDGCEIASHFPKD
jgi:hypothetical protein